MLVTDTASAERVSADAFAAGASGLEERALEGVGGTASELWVYAPHARVAAVQAAVAALAALPAGAVRWLGTEPTPDEDWSRRWREGLGVVRISKRLSVRPPFVAAEGVGGASIVIDPGQAFGTGGHASTGLALTLLDALPDAAIRGARVLDAGTGSGVLLLSALALGAASGVGFDLDGVAVHEARRNAVSNGLSGRAHFFAGPIAAVEGARFGLGLANLLRTELLPVLRDLAIGIEPGGHLVLSGLLASERTEVEAALAAVGLAVCSSREVRDPSGDAWLGLLTRR